MTEAEPDLAEAAPEPRAVDGSELLAKGMRTHRRLLEAAAGPGTGRGAG